MRDGSGQFRTERSDGALNSRQAPSDTTDGKTQWILPSNPPHKLKAKKIFRSMNRRLVAILRPIEKRVATSRNVEAIHNTERPL
jgi:hypothetical protein